MSDRKEARIDGFVLEPETSSKDGTEANCLKPETRSNYRFRVLDRVGVRGDRLGGCRQWLPLRANLVLLFVPSGLRVALTGLTAISLRFCIAKDATIPFLQCLPGQRYNDVRCDDRCLNDCEQHADGNEVIQRRRRTFTSASAPFALRLRTTVSADVSCSLPHQRLYT